MRRIAFGLALAVAAGACSPHNSGAANNQAAPPPSAQASSWQVTDRHAAIDNAEQYAAILQSENEVADQIGASPHASLGIACYKGTLTLGVVWPGYLGSEPIPVRWRADDGPIVSDRWVLHGSAGDLASVDGEGASRMFDRIRGSHKLVVELAPYGHGPTEAIFILGDVATAIDGARRACAQGGGAPSLGGK